MEVKLKPVKIIKMNLGLEQYGKAHKKFASECMERMNARYVPMRNGALKNSSFVDKECNIHYKTPYAHYIYIGQVMGPSYPIVKNGEIQRWVSPIKPKYYTGKDINYEESKKMGQEKAGPYWDKRMISAEKEEIIKVMQKYISKRGRE